ncbi:MAG: radical SAM protein, partial [Desulfobacterales bacterium]|nr:radical SAM protein [Desulfobacterales bacterium]
VVKNRMRFSLLTNGTLLTDEIVRFIANTGRCDSVQVSIDGPDRAIHDKNCGHGSFEKAIRGLKRLGRRGVNRTVRLTITQNNVDHLEEAARVLLEEIGLPSFSTNSACPFGKTRKNAGKVLLSTEQYTRAMVAHHRIIQKYGRRVNAAAGPLSSFNHWTEMDRLKKENAPPKPGGGRLTSCGGVFSKMAVR